MNTDAYRQRMKEWFDSFGPPQIAALAILGLLALILGFWFLRWSTAPTWETVGSGLRPTDAADIIGELDKAGVANRLAQGGTAVEVLTGDVARARVALGDAGVTTGRIDGYEILDRQGFTTSSFQQRVALQRALEGELERTILSFDDVNSVSVHLAIPEERLFTQQQQPTTASVVVGGSLTAGTVNSIVNAVSSAIPGLSTDHVTVTDLQGRLLSGNEAGGFGQDSQLRMRRALEAEIAAGIESQLAAALGLGRAVARVSIDMDFDEAESETVVYDPENAVVLRERVNEEAFAGNTANAPNGALGLVDDVADVGEVAGGDNDSTYLRRETTVENGVPSTRTVSRRAPGSIQRISVAVMVDSNVEGAPTVAQLETLVAAAAGIDPERGDAVVVTAVAFDEQMVPELSVEEAATGSSGIAGTMTYVTTAVSALAVLLALLFLRKGLRNLASPFGTEDGPGTKKDKKAKKGAPGADDDDSGRTGEETTQIPAVTGPSAELEPGQLPTATILDLIDQQPDEVANVLRSWMADSRN